MLRFSQICVLTHEEERWCTCNFPIICLECKCRLLSSRFCAWKEFISQRKRKRKSKLKGKQVSNSWVMSSNYKVWNISSLIFNSPFPIFAPLLHVAHTIIICRWKDDNKDHPKFTSRRGALEPCLARYRMSCVILQSFSTTVSLFEIIFFWPDDCFCVEQS